MSRASATHRRRRRRPGRPRGSGPSGRSRRARRPPALAHRSDRTARRPSRPRPRSSTRSAASAVSVTGEVLAIARTEVKPPAAAAADPVATVSASSRPGSRKVGVQVDQPREQHETIGVDGPDVGWRSERTDLGDDSVAHENVGALDSPRTRAPRINTSVIVGSPPDRALMTSRRPAGGRGPPSGPRHPPTPGRGSPSCRRRRPRPRSPDLGSSGPGAGSGSGGWRHTVAPSARR
jgi:hypothetical protein